MREFIGADVIVNTIAMLASHRDGAIWISDSDDDAKFYESRCADKRAEILPAPGLASDVLLSTKKRGLQGIIATLSERDRVLAEDEFRLDAGDVTTLLVLSPSFDRILPSIAGRKWLLASEGVTDGLRERLCRVASQLSFLRSHFGSELTDPTSAISFMSRVVKWRTFTLDLSAAKKQLLSGWNAEIETAFRDLESASVAEMTRQLRGADVLIVLTAALQNFRPRGIPPSCILSPSEILAVLRAGYDVTEFESDKMYWKLRSWERTSGHPLLANWRLLDPLGVLLDQRYWENDLRTLHGMRASQTMAAVKMDLDHFRDVNNTFGHGVGDEAIRRYCTVVKQTIGDRADVYRRGGDEVVAFFQGLEIDIARSLAEELRFAIEEHFKEWEITKQMPRPPTASIGLVYWDMNRSDQDVIRALDEAQHAAKAQGKNQVAEVILTS